MSKPNYSNNFPSPVNGENNLCHYSGGGDIPLEPKKNGCFTCLGCLGCGCLTLLIAAIIGAWLVYAYCVVGEQLKVSPETTLLTEPLKSTGKSIDYFTVIEKDRVAKQPIENNGFKTIVQSFGKAVFGDDKSSDWQFEKTCEYFALDRNFAPKFGVADVDKFSLQPEWRSQCGSKLWTLQENPKMKEFFDIMDEGLGIVRDEVLRKDGERYYQIPFVRRSENEFCVLTVPAGALAFHQQFAEYLRIRAMLRFGNNENRNAWRDYYAALAVQRIEPNVDVEGLAMHKGNGEKLRLNKYWTNDLFDAFTSRKWTTEELTQCIADIESLPQFSDRQKQFVWFHYGILDAVGSAHSLKETVEQLRNDTLPMDGQLGPWGNLGFNGNILARKINAGFADYRKKLKVATDYAQLADILDFGNAAKKDFKQQFQEKMEENGGKAVLELLTVSGRSELIGEFAGAALLQLFNAFLARQLTEETNCEVLRIVLALEKHKLGNAQYPENLDELKLKDAPLKIPAEYKRNATSYVLKVGSSGFAVEYKKKP